MKFLMLTLAAVFTFSLTSGEVAAQETLGGAGAIAAEKRPFLGIQFDNQDLDTGIRVTRIIDDSPAEKGGIKVGDIITKIEGSEVKELRTFASKIAQKKVGDSVALAIKRGDESLDLTVVLGERQKFAAAETTSGLKIEKPRQASFTSKDGLKITVDIYAPYGPEAPRILLCHQAGWSRGEYLEIAPKLNEMGFNCFAIDQRSGGSVNDVVNETNKMAVKAKKDVEFLDAEQDIVTSLQEIQSLYPGVKGKTILWGSSYSAALSLRIAGEHPDLVDGVLAFAPGEYFARFGKPKDFVATSAKKIKAPAFITSAKNEHKNWKSIFDAIPGEAGKTKTMFLPETKGNHGSRALWEKFDDHEAYWKATKGFLAQFLNENDKEKE